MKAVCIGIWMDHANAHLMELVSGNMETKIIVSTFTGEAKEMALQKGEKTMHHKEQQGQLAYYKEIAAEIKKYEQVLLFGPTGAKTELYNILKTDQQFSKTSIETKDADKMTDNQQHDFVRKYFFKHLY